MPSFESIPKTPETPPRPSAEEQERLERERTAAEEKRGFKMGADRMGRYREAVEATERDIAWKRWFAMGPQAKNDLIYQLFKEGRLPKPAPTESPPDNVVDFEEYKKEQAQKAASQAKTETRPEPEAAAPAEPPSAETAPPAPAASEAAPEPVPPAIHRWLTNLEPYAKRIDIIQQKLEAAQASDRRDPRIHRLNPLGSALHANYPAIRKELSTLLKEARETAKRENLAINNPYVKKNLRRFISEIEQRIFKLKSETSKLEHLKHPRRAAKKLFGA